MQIDLNHYSLDYIFQRLKFEGRKKQEIDFIAFAREWISTTKIKGVRNYQTVINSLTTFLSKDHLNFAQIVGRMRMYQAMTNARQKVIPKLLITDCQINSVCRDFYNNETFGVKDNCISMFDFHNLLTQSNKNSYVDTYLSRAVNATEVSVGINNVLQGYDNKFAWFLG